MAPRLVAAAADAHVAPATLAVLAGVEPRKNPAAADVFAEFKKQGFGPEGYTLYTYAAIQVFAAAAEEAKSTELDWVVKAAAAGAVHGRRPGRSTARILVGRAGQPTQRSATPVPPFGLG
jgi:ABC-type branched-subunit amino acid transport system substrate-binding protein